MSVKADLRNIATIERLCKEITRHCAHYRRNTERGLDDSTRFLLLFEDAAKLRDTAAHGVKRWQRERKS